MRYIKPSLPAVLICLMIISIIAVSLLPSRKIVGGSFAEMIFPQRLHYQVPDTNAIPADENGDLIRYGKNLVQNTAYFFGPKGIIAPITNGMNCQNCHMDGGLKAFGNPFTLVSSTYPRYRPRSGRVESIEFRVNDCLERSLDGSTIDSASYEMKAIVAYIKWTGNNVTDANPPVGTGSPEPEYLDRAADPLKGRQVFLAHCARCHGAEGGGVFMKDSTGYIYPPLWGKGSFTKNAGLYRLGRLAGFVKHNMPYDSVKLGFLLSDEDAWDVSAYITSQPRHEKVFNSDWPDISKKPFDHPFGPFADPFPESQHKYGPFDTIINYYKRNKKP
jgi:thiosulfate dehydrogenase